MKGDTSSARGWGHVHVECGTIGNGKNPVSLQSFQQNRSSAKLTTEPNFSEGRGIPSTLRGLTRRLGWHKDAACQVNCIPDGLT
jgi:hypothetical protein